MIALLIALAVIAGLELLRHLDAGMVKRQLHDLLREEAGLELDYATADIDLLHGLRLGQLVIASPPEYQALAPRLLSASELQLGWSLSSRGPSLRKLSARDLELTIVVDEEGHGNLDSLLGHPRAAQAAPALSPGQRLGALLAGLPGFDRLALQRLSVTVLRTRTGKVWERTRATGLSALALSAGEGRSRRVDLELGQAAAPLQVRVTDERDGGAGGEVTGRLFLGARLETESAELHLRASVEQQTLEKDWPERGSLIDLDARASAAGDVLHLGIDRLDGFDGAATASASFSLGPGRVHVEQTRGTLDLTRLARLVAQLPAKHHAPAHPHPEPGHHPAAATAKKAPAAIAAAPVPAATTLECQGGKVRWDGAGLEYRGGPRMDPAGHLDVEASASETRLDDPQVHLEVDGLRLDLKTRPAPGGALRATLETPIASLRYAAHGGHVEASGLHAGLDATLSPELSGHGELKLRAASGSASEARGSVRATGSELTVRLADLHLDTAHPLESSAALTLAAAIATLDGQGAGFGARAANLKLSSRSRLSHGEPGDMEIELPIERLSVTATGGEVLLPEGPARFATRLQHLRIDPAAPRRSTGDGEVDLTLGPLALKSRVKKQADALDFELSVEAARTALLTALAPPALGLPGARMSLSLQSTGRVVGLGATTRLSQKGHAHLEHAGITIAHQALAADALDIALDSDGSAAVQQVTLSLAPRGLTLEDERLGDGKLTLRARWDGNPAAPAIDLKLDGEGAAVPVGHLGLALTWKRGPRVLAYTVDGDLRHLAALEPLLPESLTDEHWIDLSDLRARVKGHGELSGLIASFDPEGTPGAPRFVPHPLETLRGDATLDVALTDVHYVDDAGVELTAAMVGVETHVLAKGDHLSARAELRMPRATLIAREHKLDFTGLSDHLELDLDGDPVSGPLELRHHFELARLEQDLLPLYPVAKLAIETRARRTPDGTLHLDELRVDNAAAGTSARLDGALVLPRPPTRRDLRSPAPLIGFSSLGLTFAAEQRMDGLSGDPARLRGTGTVQLDGRIASGDLHRFHTDLVARFHGVTIELPRQRLRAERLDGQVPIVEDVLFVRGTPPTLLPAPESNAYPQLRFTDQHPFLSGSGSLRLEKLRFGDLELDQIAASLRVTRNLFALDQLEATTRGGRVTAQCVLDLRGQDSTVALRLRATGIEAGQAGKKERFDANAALTFAYGRRSLEGRAEILRIGRHHLLDLLDEYDPHHTDVPTNRVRTALSLGYPDRVRLLLDRGFASYKVSFGGLARLVKVHEVQGIPTGQIVERYLGRALAREAP